MRTKSLRMPPSASTRHRPPLIRPLTRSLRRQTSLSPATGRASLEAEQFADALIVEPARAVDADQHLIGGENGGGVDLVAADDAAFAIVAVGDFAAGADDLATGG